MSRAVADTSVFIARETGRPLGDLPDDIAVSVVTAAELELGVLRAADPRARASRLRTPGPRGKRSEVDRLRQRGLGQVAVAQLTFDHTAADRHADGMVATVVHASVPI